MNLRLEGVWMRKKRYWVLGRLSQKPMNKAAAKWATVLNSKPPINTILMKKMSAILNYSTNLFLPKSFNTYRTPPPITIPNFLCFYFSETHHRGHRNFLRRLLPRSNPHHTSRYLPWFGVLLHYSEALMVIVMKNEHKRNH